MYSANKKEVHTKDVPVHEKDQKVRPRYSEGPTMLEGVQLGETTSPFDDQGEHSSYGPGHATSAMVKEFT